MTFSQLAIGDKFIFQSEVDYPFSGMAKGPWIKTSTNKYVDAEDPTSSHRVGTTRVKVIHRGKGNPGIEGGKWIPVHAVRFNQDGSVSLLGEHASTDNPAKLSRFQKLERQLEAKGAYSPGGLARYIGVKKYGAKGFARLQARGRKKR